MPFGGALVTAGLGLASSIPKFYASYQQNKQANALKLADPTTPEEREQLAMSRQAAATSRMPGQGQMENRLGMVQAGAVQNARMGAASSADFLASAGAADARQQQGEQQLGVQGQQFQAQGRLQLRSDLKMASQRRQHDLDTYNANKAALLQGSATNLDNGIGQIASYGAQALNMYENTQGTPAGAGGAGGAGGNGGYGNGGGYGRGYGFGQYGNNPNNMGLSPNYMPKPYGN